MARWTHRCVAPLTRPVRDATEALLGRTARAVRLQVRPEHLSILDGSTLNLAVVLSETSPVAPATVEFTSGPRRARAPARTAPTTDGHTRVEVTVRLRTGEPSGSSRFATRIPEVELPPGRWNVRLLLGEGGWDRCLGVAAPGAEAAVPLADSARAGLVRTLSGAAAVSVAPHRPTANVHSVVLLPHRAQVHGELLDAGAPDTIAAEMALRGGETVSSVRPALSPGYRGNGFTVELPLAAMAAATPGVGVDLHWELRFRIADGRALHARRPDHAPETPRFPAQTVRPEDGPPVLLRPYYADTTTLTVVVTVLPSGA